MLGLFLSSGLARAADFQPDLGQTLDWLESARPGQAVVPADSYQLTRHPMQAEPVVLELDQVPGRPFHVVDPPPMKRLYYKYPIYTALGLPRDLVDGFVGFVGFIPIVNLGIVGVGYEVVPTQVFFRDFRDWHHWGGTRNKNGHGWIDSDGWGWFPNAHQTKFEKIDKRKLARYNAANATLSAELQGLNKEIKAKNDAIHARQNTARDYALYWIDNNDPREAVSWILPAHRAYPLDEDLQGVLVASLAAYADVPEAPVWVEPLLWQKLTNSLSRVQRASESRLEDLFTKRPQSFSVARALVYIKTVMGDPKGALTVAQNAFNVDPADAARARMYFETAVTARKPDLATAALESLEKSTPETSGAELLGKQLTGESDPLELLRLRLRLVSGELDGARDLLLARAEQEPSNAYYQYYLGCTELDLAPTSENALDSISQAGDRFEQARLLAGNAPLRIRSGIALTFIKSMTQPTEKKEKTSSSGFSGLSF